MNDLILRFKGYTEVNELSGVEKERERVFCLFGYLLSDHKNDHPRGKTSLC